MNVIFWNGGAKHQSNVEWDTFTRTVGPYKIAHWMRKHGYTTQVIDFVANLSNSELYLATKKFIDSTTIVLGISTTFLSNYTYTWKDGQRIRFPEQCIEVLKQIKLEYPNIKIILGGYISDRLPAWDIIDASIMSYTGSSEDVFLEYVRYINGQGVAPIGRLIFPAFEGKTGKHRMHYDTARNSRYNIEHDDFKFIQQDCILDGEPLPLDVSRGCIFACKFCQYTHLGKKKYDYVRGMKFIEEELVYNKEQFNTDKYYILDDTFNDTERKMKEFYEMTTRLNFPIKYSGFLRADLLERYPAMTDYLKNSGLTGCFIGVESLNPAASKFVGKAWSGKRAREYLPKLVHDIWNSEIAMNNTFIVGLPQEDKSSILETAKWVIDNKIHSAQFYHLHLYGKQDNGNQSVMSIESEFDKYPEKYGFSTEYKIERGVMTWKNKLWDNFSAVDFAAHTQSIVDPHLKSNIWNILALEWFGYSNHDLLTIPKRQLDLNFIEDITKRKYAEYYNKLMSL